MRDILSYSTHFFYRDLLGGGHVREKIHLVSYEYEMFWENGQK